VNKILTIIIITILAEGNFINSSSRIYNQRHPLVIEGERERPPYEFCDKNGIPSGFNVELLSKIAVRLKIPYKVILKNWPDVVQDIHLGKADLACSLYSDDKRGLFKFSYSVFDIYHNNVVYKKNGPQITSFRDLNKKTICVLRKSAALDYLKRKHFNGKIITSNNMKGVIDSVSQGKAFAAITGQQSARYNIYKGEYSDLKTADIGLLTAEYHFVSQDTVLLGKVDSVYTILAKNGEADALYNAWFHSKVEKDVIPPFVFNAVFLLILAILLLIAFSIVYKKKFKKASLIINEKSDELQALFGVTAVSVLRYSVKDKHIYNLMGNSISKEGYSLETIKSKIHSDEQQLFEDIVRDLSDGTINNYNYVFRCDFRNKGKWPYIETVMKRVISRVDQHVDIIISVKDITDSFINNIKKDSLFKRYEAVFNSSNIGLVYFDQNDVLTDLNDMAKSMLAVVSKSALVQSKIKLETILGRYISVSDLRRPFYGIIKYDFSVIRETIPDFKRKGIAYIELQITPLLDENNELTGSIVTLLDNTDERNRHIQDRLLRKELEEETAKAQEADTLKSAFLANMSHEIRTPLNSIVGFSDLLCQSDNAEEKEQFRKIISGNTAQLLRLINDILDISKMDANLIKIEPKEIDFSVEFHNIYDTLHNQINKPDVDFAIDNPYTHCIITIDKERIRQLITNLVINAGKFTDSGHIRIGYKYRDGELYLYCEDTGKGIPEDDIDKIFDRFYKGDDFIPGTGLGLSICQKIVKQNHGRIKVESKLGKGSIFKIWIPAEAKLIE
jgi:signal transduction histidine kinase/ABC-type amino acid transport substrate-binding protein